MNVSQVITAYLAYLSGKGSFKFRNHTITIQNTGTGPVKFSYATALAAIEASVLLTGKVLPQTVVIGSTSVTVS